MLGNLLSVNERTSSAHSPQQFLEFIHSFLSTALDLSRYITLSLSPDNSHGVILTPDWNISVLSQEEILNAHSPYPVSYSLSLSCQSSLYVTLENLPIGTHNLSSTQYPIYTPLKTSHHYYKFHSKRMLANPSSKVKRKAHMYQKGALAMQPLPTKLGDMTPNIPYAGSPSRLLPGDLVILYGDDTESNILKIKEFHWPRKFLSLDHGEREYQLEIESLHPGLCFIHFYIICQSNSSLSHMIPDHQPIDSYPALLRSQLEPEQYLSHLFTLSIHVKAYEYPPISSSVGTTELISTVEMALNSSIHDNIPTKEVVVCSKYLLTEVRIVYYLS